MNRLVNNISYIYIYIISQSRWSENVALIVAVTAPGGSCKLLLTLEIAPASRPTASV